jgi:hypothetical protein
MGIAESSKAKALGDASPGGEERELLGMHRSLTVAGDSIVTSYLIFGSVRHSSCANLELPIA